MMTLTRRTFVLLTACGVSGIVKADDNSESAAAVNSIRSCIERDEIEKVWDRYTSDFFKSKMQRVQFVESIRKAHVDLGSPTASNLLGSSVSFSDPAMGYTGTIHTYDYKVRYGKGEFVERFVLVKEPDQKFRLAGLWSFPQPAQTAGR